MKKESEWTESVCVCVRKREKEERELTIVVGDDERGDAVLRKNSSIGTLGLVWAQL